MGLVLWRLYCAAWLDATQAVCSTDYDVHYDPFQYYPSTANPHHLPPSSTALVGHQGDQANHQYDLAAFQAALEAGNLPR